jgi:hypothetical protein
MTLAQEKTPGKAKSQGGKGLDLFRERLDELQADGRAWLEGPTVFARAGGMSEILRT